MGNPDAGAGEHCDRELEHHRHVDGDSVALFQAQALEHVGELLHFGEQFGVGHRDRVAGLTLPVERNLVAFAGLDVSVETVVRKVELATDEPFRERQLPLEHRVEILVPREQLTGLAGPEGLIVGLGLIPHRAVVGVRLRHERCGRRKPSVLALVNLDRTFGHGGSPWMNGAGLKVRQYPSCSDGTAEACIEGPVHTSSRGNRQHLRIRTWLPLDHNPARGRCSDDVGLEHRRDEFVGEGG